MAAGSSVSAESAENKLVLERVFDAPLDRIWEAWSDRDQMAQWLGPRGFTGEILKMDTRVGGSYRYVMRAPDGTAHWVQGTYREIVPRERLVYSWIWTDAAGIPSGPDTLVTVVFSSLGDKTRIKLEHTMFQTAGDRDNHQQGWSSCFDHFNDFLASAAK
jgi:uncharacterized protein YndB with AHSA1/START domain